MRTLIATLLLACSFPALAGDPNSPHPHLGIAPKFKNPDRTQPTAAEAAKLATGESVRKQIQYVFYRFIYETERHNGIAELLEILVRAF